MIDFNREIANYKNYGTYIYKFDDVGNEMLNPSSSTFQQVYFSLPLGNVVYNNSKIVLFYDPTFTEFVPVTGSNAGSVFPQEAIDQINAITSDNIQLQNQLLDLINNSEQNSSEADAGLIKNIIISLRIQLGQGATTSDFDTIFPYMPIPVEFRDSTTTVQIVPSTAASTVQPTIITQTSIVSNTEQPTITNTGVGDLTDSEIAAISASAGVGQAGSSAGSSAGVVKYVIPSPQFGITIVGVARIIYYRIILFDPSSRGGTGQWEIDSIAIQRDLIHNQPLTPTNISNTGNPIHGQYVSMTRDQYISLTDNPKAKVVINGVTYMGVDKWITDLWVQQSWMPPNGNSILQNYERYNGPGMLPGADRWRREQQVGYLGILGPA